MELCAGAPRVLSALGERPYGVGGGEEPSGAGGLVRPLPHPSPLLLTGGRPAGGPPPSAALLPRRLETNVQTILGCLGEVRRAKESELEPGAPRRVTNKLL